ncbi:hypothetical protein [Rathayibacter soli]|uniref:hypothetical protein n=1 Tax=Rathayibacter soli TaxID=3144168 RepID=UPI0027E3C7A2|nr:hypothetical protein [Glaciibacter superstes]
MTAQMIPHKSQTERLDAIRIAADADRACRPADILPLSRSSRALWGWSPPTRPPVNTLAQRVDRMLPRSGWSCLLYLIGVAALLGVAPYLPTRAQLGADGVAFVAAGGWCALNFWLCRHAHCLVTGVGWTALAILTFVEVGVGKSLIAGDEQLVFLSVLGLALGFEAVWCVARGTNAVTLGDAAGRASVATTSPLRLASGCAIDDACGFHSIAPLNAQPQSLREKLTDPR